MKDYPFADLTDRIIGAAIEVHRELGPGLLESAYQACLCEEFRQKGIEYKTEIELPIQYKGRPIDASYRIDVLVEKQVVIELKSVNETTSVHEAQLLTYMKLARKQVGLLINFNTDLLKNGIKRRVL